MNYIKKIFTHILGCIIIVFIINVFFYFIFSFINMSFVWIIELSSENLTVIRVIDSIIFIFILILTYDIGEKKEKKENE